MISVPQHFPNFIVIGPGKSGTSWLYHVLGQHPEVCMSTAKETLYFEDYYHKGLDWYARFFKKCHVLNKPHAIGEISNTYIFSELAAERIARDFPAMKIIATLRDPTERAFSHYLFLRRNGEVNCDFEQALDQRPDLVSRGNYHQHLQPYRDRFPSEQLAVFVFDDLVHDVEDYAHRLFSFLDIADLADPDLLHTKVLEASEARSRWLAKATVASAQVVRRLGFPDIVTRVKQGVLPKLIFKPLKKESKPKLVPAVERRLREYYLPDLERLSDWLQRDLVAAWGPRVPVPIEAGGCND
ncbi:MAG: sulfotransferase domain-containing protein [Pirellulaceae bacterium]